MKKTLVLGIGNKLLSDEGAGLHLLGFLKRTHPDLAEVSYVDGGTLSFTLADRIAETDNLIVLDAAELGKSPGSVKSFVGKEMDRFLGKAKRSVHEVGLLDLMDIARLTTTLPKHRALVGIQPERFDWGQDPSEAVADAIPVAACKVLELIRLWSAGQEMPAEVAA
ncbi:MAG: HyaD/HybD family hydrogenase maturation endopeptidase [Chromatiales bacterium]|nr:HyaD/HybD family hydrogenase maturation endopeptidase [Chromatiales bacterium]